MTNSPDLSLARHGRQPIFLGLCRLQAAAERNPDVSLPALAATLRRLSADEASVDYATAVLLYELFEHIRLDESPDAMRLFLAAIIDSESPAWLSAAVRGRAKIVAGLSKSTRQCFAYGGLLAADPADEALAWWAQLARSQRVAGDETRKLIGLEGERLTMRLESARLARLTTSLKPKWMSIDDEWLGYDVLSYDVGTNGLPSSKLIEVKACSTDHLEVFVSRSEWEKATRAENYCFHFWHLPTRTFCEVPAGNVEPDIPGDRGDGRWETASIRFKKEALTRPPWD